MKPIQFTTAFVLLFGLLDQDGVGNDVSQTLNPLISSIPHWLASDVLSSGGGSIAIILAVILLFSGFTFFDTSRLKAITEFMKSIAELIKSIAELIKSVPSKKE
ncbi:MAG: hypothetical protein AAGA60_13045 [Cyanobacteria bacterium P01_E01_bin.42]